jgi:hypothetical protein
MKNYLDAYKERIQRNNDKMLSLANELKKDGFTVYKNKSGFVKFIKVFKENQHVLIGFEEVPYRWYARKTLDYRKGNGSSRTIDQNFDLDNGYSIEEVKSFMSEYPFSTDLEKLDKQLSYLERI